MFAGNACKFRDPWRDEHGGADDDQNELSGVMADEIEEQIQRLQRAVRENHELFMGTIRAMAQAIDAKDPYTRGHSMRVNRYSVILAKELGLKGAQLREIHVSSLMHDVGKIGINDKILQKPGKLTDEEFEEEKRKLLDRR